jgi:hypothetical protein
MANLPRRRIDCKPSIYTYVDTPAQIAHNRPTFQPLQPAPAL